MKNDCLKSCSTALVITLLITSVSYGGIVCNDPKSSGNMDRGSGQTMVLPELPKNYKDYVGIYKMSGNESFVFTIEIDKDNIILKSKEFGNLVLVGKKDSADEFEARDLTNNGIVGNLKFKRGDDKKILNFIYQENQGQMKFLMNKV